MSFQTIDLDFNDTERLMRVLQKVNRCRWCIAVSNVSPSCSNNGYHITYSCTRPDLCICRWVFDDQKRVHADDFRPIWSRNVLFDAKTLMRNSNKRIELRK